MLWIAPVFRELPFPPIKEQFCQSVFLATQPHKREREGKKQGVTGRWLHLLTHHDWLKRLGKNRRKVRLKNNRTFQWKYICLIEERLEAVIFIPQNAELFFRQFHKINKREVVLSWPLILTVAGLRYRLSFPLLFRFRPKYLKRGKSRAVSVLYQRFSSDVSTLIIYDTSNKALRAVTWTRDLIGAVSLLASLFCWKAWWEEERRGGERGKPGPSGLRSEPQGGPVTAPWSGHTLPALQSRAIAQMQQAVLEGAILESTLVSDGAVQGIGLAKWLLGAVKMGVSRLWSGYRESLNSKREMSVIFSEAKKNNPKNSLTIPFGIDNKYQDGIYSLTMYLLRPTLCQVL